MVLSLLEFHFVHSARDDFRGRDVRNSGGDALFIAPALQWIATERLLFEASVQLPLLQKVNGPQPETDHNVLVGFRFVY